VVTALVVGRSVRWNEPGFLIATGVLLLCYMVVPDYIGDGADVPARIALYAFVFSLFWISRRAVPRWAQGAGVIAATLVVVGLMLVRIPSHAVLDEDIREYLSGEAVIEPGSTVLPMWLTDIEEGRGPGGGGRIVRPLVELAGEMTADGDVVDLHHLPAALDLALFRFAPGYDIRETTDEGEPSPFTFGPGMVDIEEFEGSGGGRVDYIWLWGRSVADPELLESDRARRTLALIDDAYELVFVSEPRGLLEVYTRHPDS